MFFTRYEMNSLRVFLNCLTFFILVMQSLKVQKNYEFQRIVANLIKYIGQNKNEKAIILHLKNILLFLIGRKKNC